MDAQPSRPPVSLVGSSIPRSGHHFLVRILRRAYRHELSYCGVYNVADCCGQVPCARAGDYAVKFQKSHDWDLSLPTDLDGVTYVVQHRHPVPQALSDLELYERERIKAGKPVTVATRAGLELWLARSALYHKRFHDKWTGRPADNIVFVPYEALAGDPAGTVAALLARAGAAPLPDGHLSRAAEAASSQGGKRRAYKPRIVEENRYFDAAVFGAYESLLLDIVPRFGHARTLPAVDYRRTSLYRRFLVHRLASGALALAGRRGR